MGCLLYPSFFSLGCSNQPQTSEAYHREGSFLSLLRVGGRGSALLSSLCGSRLSADPTLMCPLVAERREDMLTSRCLSGVCSQAARSPLLPPHQPKLSPGPLAEAESGQGEGERPPPPLGTHAAHVAAGGGQRIPRARMSSATHPLFKCWQRDPERRKCWAEPNKTQGTAGRRCITSNLRGQRWRERPCCPPAHRRCLRIP